MNIAIDTGNKNIKTVSQVFVSGIAERATEPTMSPKTDWIRYNGTYYVLSELREEYLRDKSESNRYFILALIGIVKELERAESLGQLRYDRDTEYNVRLLTGLPPAHMEDGDLKKNYRRYFNTGGPVQVFYNGRTWVINIRSVRIYAQCFAALMSKPELLIGKNRVLAVDIGGLTSDYMELIKGKIVPEHTDSMENGVIPFYRSVARACRKKFDAIVDESDVDAILLDGDVGSYEPELVDVVYAEAERYADKFLSTFRELQIDLKYSFVVFLGGGSVLLWKFLQKSPLLRNCTLLPDVKANAIGYDKMYRNSSKNTGNAEDD